LNTLLLSLSTATTNSATSIAVQSLAYSAMDAVPIEKDFGALQQSDQVVFQDDDALSPPFTNSRVSEYRRYIDQRGEYVPIKIWSDVTAYSKHCGG
jgi:hypothetical protein